MVMGNWKSQVFERMEIREVSRVLFAFLSRTCYPGCKTLKSEAEFYSGSHRSDLGHVGKIRDAQSKDKSGHKATEIGC